MSAVRNANLRVPVINLSWPDGTNPIMARLGLSPNLGLGNATMIWARVRAALMRHIVETSTDPCTMPLVRVLGDASTLWPVLSCMPPKNANKGCRIYLGEEGSRGEEWAYRGRALESGSDLNELTCASSVPVIEALLPHGPAVRASCPGVNGLPGGYPIRIDCGRIEFDLPPGLTLDEAIAFNTSLARNEGIARIESDGTVIYNDHARRVMSNIDPILAEPLTPSRAIDRFPRLMAALSALRDGFPMRQGYST
jgi:hypothetical protein